MKPDIVKNAQITDGQIKTESMQATLDYKSEYYKLMKEYEELKKMNTLFKNVIKNLGILLDS